MPRDMHFILFSSCSKDLFPSDSQFSIGTGYQSREQVLFDGEIFLRENTEPTIFSIWPVGYSDMNPRGLDHLE